MPVIEERIRECCDAVDSNKITERKKRISELKAYIERNDVKELINLNTKNKNVFTWDYILLASHRAVIKEADRLRADENKGKFCGSFDSSKANISDLLKSIVRNANSGGLPRLSCTTLMECLFNVLDDAFLRKHFGFTFVNILHEQILSNHKYCTEISSDSWHDLFERGINFYEEQTEGPEQCNIAACLEHIVRKGCSQSYLALAVKKRFPFLTAEIKGLINSSMGLKENILQLALTMCQKLFKECRMLICKFGEDIMDELIHLYEFRAGAVARKQAILLDFLLLQVQAHHPKGTVLESKGAYAYHWDTWKRHLRCLYRLITGEVKQIVRRSRTSSDGLMPSNFLTLSVEVCKQVFEDTSCSVLEMSNISILNDSTASSAPKRCRLETGIPAILSQLSSVKNSVEIWPWLCLLDALISKYPKLICESDMEQLLQFLCDQLLTCKEAIVMKYLCSCCISLLKVENHLNPALLDIRLTARLWEHIWDTILRAAGLNMCEEDSHALLQALIANKKNIAVAALLQMYISGAVPFSKHSVYTLNMITQYWSILDIVGVQGCKTLLDWIFPSTKDDLTLIELNTLASYYTLIPRVALSLTLKSCAPHACSKDKADLDDVENHILLSTFEQGLLLKSEDCPSNQQNSQMEGVFQMDEMLGKALHTLISRDSYDLLKYSVINTSTSMHRLVYHCSNLLKMATLIHFWNLPTNQELFDLMDKITVKMITIATHILENEEEFQVLNSVLQQLEKLWHQSAENSLEFNSIVLSRSPVEKLLKASLNLASKNYSLNQVNDFTDDDSNFISFVGSSPLDPEAVKGQASVTLQATKTLVQYCRNQVNDESCNIRYNLLLSLFKLPDFEDDSNPALTVQMAVAVAKGALTINEMDVDVLYQIFLCVRSLSRLWHASSHVSLVLFDIFKSCMEQVHNLQDPQNYSYILTLVKGFSKFVKERKYGAEVTAKFVEVLGHFAVVDPDENWAKWDGTTEALELTPISHEVLSYLCNPFYEVRISAACVVFNIFSTAPSEESNFLQKDLAFKNLLEFVLNGFIVEGELITEEEIDESVTRTASALHSIAAVICAKCHWRRKALSTLFYLTVNKRLNLDLVKKVLKQVGHHLNLENILQFLESNLNFIISDWFGKYGFNDLKEFPWSLLDSNSQKDFFSKYSKYIVLNLLYSQKSEVLKDLSIKLRITPSKLIQDCFPTLIGGVLPMLSDPLLEQKGIELFDTIQQYIGSDTLKDLISLNLPEVVISIIRRQHDPDQIKTLCGSTNLIFPDPGPIHFKTDTILGAFKYLQDSSPNPEVPLMKFLSKEMPGHVQKILLNLYVDVHLATTPEFRLCCLQHYLTVCDMLTLILNPRHLKSTGFIINFILNSLLHLVSGESALTVLAFMNQLINNVLPACASEINSLLPVVVATLIPIAQQQTDSGKQSLSILNNLFENYSDILPGIALLDPLPEDHFFMQMSMKYKEIRYRVASDHSLESEIKHFIEADIKNHPSIYRLEGLRSLRIQLSENKIQLSSLYKELESLRGFSEDCANSILHRLICLLVNLTSSENPDIRMEAARCLGELGPGNLTTLVLKPDCSYLPATELLDLLCYVATELSHFLVDFDISTMQEASGALYTLFLSPKNHAIVGRLSKVDKILLYPFIHSSRKRKKVDENGMQEVVQLQSVAEYFCPTSSCSHKEWITRLVCALLEFCHLKYLVPVCKIKVSFAEGLLPYVVSVLLQTWPSSEAIVINEVNKFFNTSSDEILKSSQTDNSEEAYCNRASVHCMLNVVNTIRLHNKDLRKIPNLNYLDIAKAAQFCSAYFTSIMYTQLWCYTNLSSSSDYPQRGFSKIDVICERHKENGLIVQNLLREAYLKIGEPDAVYGCGNAHVFDPTLRIKYYENERKWNRVIGACDYLTSKSQQDCEDLRYALHRSGLHYLASCIKDSTGAQSYESAWRLSQWDIAEGKGTIEDSYNSLLYIALRAVHNCDKLKAVATINTARQQVIASLKHVSLEAANNIYPPLAQLLGLQELQDFGDNELSMTLNKWENQEKIGFSEFIHAEPVLAQRSVLLRSKGDSSQECIEVFLRAADIARIESSYAIAERWLCEAALFPNLNNLSLFTLKLQEACLHWDMGANYVARNLLHPLLSKIYEAKIRDPNLSKIYSKALRIYGSWMASTKLENAQQIINNYFKNALTTASESDVQNQLATFATLAQFADSEYKIRLKYVQSTQYSSKVEFITKSMEQACQLRDQAEKFTFPSDFKKSILIHKNQSEIDRKEVENTQKELDNYLTLAIKYYLKSLVFGDVDDLKVFRVVSLWLENCDNTNLHRVLELYLRKIPTYKFLPVLPQLIARMSDSADMFTVLLQNLIERCTIEHPHHVLPLLLALSNSYKDNDYLPASSNNKKTKLEPRVIAAQQLISSLDSKGLGTLLNDMQLLAEAYISLANFPKPDNFKATEYKIPENQLIMKLEPLENILCPVVTLHVNKFGKYDDIVGVYKHEDSCHYVGGINAPKKLYCIGSDGIKRPMLLKGNDDLRQDAVMQQVFTIMNTLLSKNKETQRRKLVMRTYKVVPLSQRSGVIEWCTNTIPLSLYLVGDRNKLGAHAKYRPSDWLHQECRKKLGDVHHSSPEDKRDVFDEICKNFKPVFRYFFLEKFPSPGIWFERQLAYTHSVATSSMIGYILGLGDRHIMNILIDEITAEVIHIDFGIAFEQGHILPTPETVPFRLTRDIEDGMGVSGTEGVFHRSCEKTMNVLRENQDTILTILSVLLYDPLYVWTITPEKAHRKQKENVIQPKALEPPPTEVNKLAERALVRLRHKLEGREDGSTYSVEGQVTRLINKAMNPDNLCRLYQGWQAFV